MQWIIGNGALLNKFYYINYPHWGLEPLLRVITLMLYHYTTAVVFQGQYCPIIYWKQIYILSELTLFPLQSYSYQPICWQNTYLTTLIRVSGQKHWPKWLICFGSKWATNSICAFGVHSQLCVAIFMFNLHVHQAEQYSCLWVLFCSVVLGCWYTP